MHGWRHRVQGMESAMLQQKPPAEQIRPYGSLFQVTYVRIHRGDVQKRILQSGYRPDLQPSRPVQSQSLLLQSQTDIQLHLLHDHQPLYGMAFPRNRSCWLWHKQTES